MKIFFVVLGLCICLLQEGQIVQAYCFLTDQSIPIRYRTLWEITELRQFIFSLFSGFLPYNGVILVALLCWKLALRHRQFVCWGSLIVAVISYCFFVLNLWVPVIEGARMSSTFAIGSLFTSIYTCFLATAGGYLGHRIWKMRSLS